MTITKYRVLFDNGHAEFATLAAAQAHAELNGRPSPIEITEEISVEEQTP